MDDDVRWSQMAPPWLRRLPADLAAAVGLTLLTVGAVFLPGVRETPLRLVVGLPFVLFVPGYALIAALFPEARRTDRGAAGDSDAHAETETDVGLVSEDGRITGLERAALSFGGSIAVVPLVSLVLNFTPFGVRLVPIVASLTVLVVGLTVVAVQRRRRLPPEDRFAVPWRDWVRSGRTELFDPGSRTDAALNVLLAVSVLIAVGSVGYAVAMPKPGEAFTEFYLLTENDDGELVAEDYPTELVAGESQSLVVGVGNQEHRPTEYTVIVELQDVAVENNTTRVLESDRLQTFERQVGHNETWQRQHDVTPEMTGEQLRLTYLLYKGDPPSNPTAENAYRELHLWVNVTERGTAAAVDRPTRLN